MKFIEKTGKTPQELTTWKNYHSTNLYNLYCDAKKTGKEIWEYLDNHEALDSSCTNIYNKKKLKSSLLKDQGYICCYCGKRILDDFRTILEHLHPKSKYKDKTYDYTNLLASCDGGSAYKIHQVKNSETLESIATDYDVSKEYLIEVYVDIPSSEHIKKLTKLYDIENLKQGDRLFIIPKLASKFQHCDSKKNNFEIPLSPTQINIENFFTYLPNGMIDVSKDKNLAKTVEVLGLNKVPLLIAERKNIVSSAINKKRVLLKACKNDPILYGKAIDKLILQYSTRTNDMLEAFSFVTISALK